VTDELSGTNDVQIFLNAPRADGALLYQYCSPIRLSSGDVHDGVWTASIPIEEDQLGGDWSVWIGTRDRAHRDSAHWLNWWGPGEYVYHDGDLARDRPFPDNMGTVRILGRTRTDSTAPTMSSVQVTPDHVDTLPGPATVDVTLSAADVGRGVSGVYVQLMPSAADENPPYYLSASLNLVAGSHAEGTWSGSISLAQGVPPGTYYVRVMVWDRDQNTSYYVSSSCPNAWYAMPIESNPTVTIVDSTSP
jgi:hypothetical protein